jgi:uncharacterized membrane protein
LSSQILPAREKQTALSVLPLLVLLLISVFFALYKSNSAFTSDEVWSVRVASLNFQAEMDALKADVHPPLYFQFLYGWIRLFGTGERTVRTLSGLFYLLSVFALYGLARSLYGNKAALLASAVYAASPLAILSAQFARMYSLLSLLAILSTWLFLQFTIQQRESRLRLIAYVLINILGTFTHIAFFFVLFGQVVTHLLTRRRAHLLRLILLISLSLIPYVLLWGQVLLRQVSHSQEGIAWVGKPAWSTYLELLLLYGGPLWILLPVIIYLRWRSRTKPALWLNIFQPEMMPAWLLGITILTPLLLSEIKPIFNARLAIVGLHLFALVVALILADASARNFLSFELLALSLLGIVILHPGFSSCDNRAAATFLNGAANDGDAIIFTSLTRLPVDYYLNQIPAQKKLLETSFPAEIDNHPGYEGRVTGADRKTDLDNEARELAERLEQMFSHGGNHRVFVFRGFHPELDAILEKRLAERFHFNGIALKCDETSPYFNQIVVWQR